MQSDDPEVIRIAHDVAGSGKDALQAAPTLQSWTHDQMSLDLGVALAPASEVVRDRHGTCVAYSMLLGSLIRSEEIPTRVMMGYAYVEGRWGGHAWIEMWDGSRWVPFDAALYRSGPSDAARVAFMASSLQEGLPLGPLSQMYGNVAIRTLDYTYHGHRTVIPKDAKPYSVVAGTYRNRWLGVTVPTLPGFSLGHLNEGWPDSTVLQMRGPHGSMVEIHLMESGKGAAAHCLELLGITGTSKVAAIKGRNWVEINGRNSAGAAFEDDDQVWAIKASGPQASILLRKTLNRLQFARP